MGFSVRTTITYLMILSLIPLTAFTSVSERAFKQMAGTANEPAMEVGLSILDKGGNAVDAAVAIGFALAVTFPEAGGLGGGGFMMIRIPSEGIFALDFREKAPSAATPEMYLKENGDLDLDKSWTGALAAGVPGNPAGLLAAHQRFGKLPLAEVIAPAIELAEKGFPLNWEEANWFNRLEDDLRQFDSSRKYFVKENSPWRAGDILIRKDLAKTLKLIRDQGQKGFYEGEVADAIVKEMGRNGGLITKQDLASYSANWTQPLEVQYRTWTIHTMPPPSGGGFSLVQCLKMLSAYDLKKIAFFNSEYLHLIGEVLRRSFADRTRYISDPSFVQMPLDTLLDATYLKERMLSFDPETTSSSEVVGPGKVAPESSETTHFNVIDAQGNAVACTITLNGHFGSRLAVDGAGFLLNNQMNDFSIRQGIMASGLVAFGMADSANQIAPNKRMTSSMCPTIAIHQNGETFFTIGGVGGTTIMSGVLQVLLNLIDFEMNPQEAVDAPRIHHQWRPDAMWYEHQKMPRDVQVNLESKGWRLDERKRLAEVNCIIHHKDGLEGGIERRDRNFAKGR